MDPQDLVVAYTTNNSAEAEIVKNFLVDEGIPCMIAGERQMELAGIIEVQLLVHANDLERAQAMIAENQAADDELDNEEWSDDEAREEE